MTNNPIYKRRSIRLYENKKVPFEKLYAIIKAGMNAPSACDQQPWHFIIIDEPTLLDQISETHPRASEVIKSAPAGILICGDLSLEISKGYWSLDCAASTQNMLLETVNQSLGGTWIGIYPREQRYSEIKKILKLPENIIPFSLITLGYPAETKEEKNIFNRDKIKINGWNTVEKEASWH